MCVAFLLILCFRTLTPCRGGRQTGPAAAPSRPLPRFPQTRWASLRSQGGSCLSPDPRGFRNLCLSARVSPGLSIFQATFRVRGGVSEETQGCHFYVLIKGRVGGSLCPGCTSPCSLGGCICNTEPGRSRGGGQ